MNQVLILKLSSSKKIALAINELLRELQERDNAVYDYDNPWMVLDRIEHCQDEGKFYCFFKEKVKCK